jgi:hypothetical protein
MAQRRTGDWARLADFKIEIAGGIPMGGRRPARPLESVGND